MSVPDWVPELLPVVLGVLFLYAGLHKALFPTEPALALESLEIPPALAKWVILIVTTLEIYLSILLLFRISLSSALTGASILLFAFATYLWYLSTLADPPSCGCIGLTSLFDSNKDAAIFGLVRNVLLLYLVSVYRRSSVIVFKTQQLQSG